MTTATAKTAMKSLVVLVPKPDTQPAKWIIPGSGIVTADSGDDAAVEVYYEGNRYGSSDMQTFEQKVHHAAGRLDAKYPTIARGRWATVDFEPVGVYRFSADWQERHLEIFNQEAVDRWCANAAVEDS